ncbi:hypothetical protein HK103_003478 [Boothiomyces macroporosus]|uniref:Uncharacterized protein n=1 Tax=Boothiomyces macroporosus TaxID=261099 RepID=A0AAD5Y293_9FUNG|nr:hypothetical protein HK103_003478 [Boothiomyces macroporosus]
MKELQTEFDRADVQLVLTDVSQDELRELVLLTAKHSLEETQIEINAIAQTAVQGILDRLNRQEAHTMMVQNEIRERNSVKSLHKKLSLGRTSDLPIFLPSAHSLKRNQSQVQYDVFVTKDNTSEVNKEQSAELVVEDAIHQLKELSRNYNSFILQLKTQLSLSNEHLESMKAITNEYDFYTRMGDVISMLGLE